MQILLFLIENCLNLIIGALLPIFMSWRPRSRSVGIRIGQNRTQLFEFIAVVGGGIVLDILCDGRSRCYKKRATVAEKLFTWLNLNTDITGVEVNKNKKIRPHDENQ